MVLVLTNNVNEHYAGRGESIYKESTPKYKTSPYPYPPMPLDTISASVSTIDSPYDTDNKERLALER